MKLVELIEGNNILFLVEIELSLIINSIVHGKSRTTILKR